MTTRSDITIRADCIAFEGNTAWIVLADGVAAARWREFDRPCNTCDGRTRYEGDGFVCPDCIDGRRAFEIEVEVWFDALDNAWVGGQRRVDFDHVGAESSRRTAVTYRVSIVAGMVLPIVEDADDEPDMIALVTLSPNGAAEYWDANEVEQGIPITLPLAARPGMWAVKLWMGAA